jgi:hypothetical protein
MPTFNIKKNCKVYLVTSVNGTLEKHTIQVYPDLTFSQTFEEQAINVKTLHDQDAMFEDAIINRANPASFSFTVLVQDSVTYNTLIAWLSNKNPTRDGSVEAVYSSDLYIDTGVDLFKLTKSALERATFNIQRDTLITVSLQGTASKLSLIGASGTAIPGTPVASSGASVWPKYTAFDLNGINLPNVAGITLEVVNTIEWLPCDTLHKSLNITGPADTMYPESFFVSTKSLTGTITQYLSSTNDVNLQQWSTSGTLRIRLGFTLGNYFLDINLPKVVYTNRLDTQDVFGQIYDFRLTSNSVDIYTLLQM